jgi:hypothetical protein
MTVIRLDDAVVVGAHHSGAVENHGTGMPLGR